LKATLVKKSIIPAPGQEGMLLGVQGFFAGRFNEIANFQRR
jgi:hypothetical protein